MYLKGIFKMNKEALLNLGLNEEQAVKVLDGFKDYIPKSRFDEVNERMKNAEAQLKDRDAQLTELKKTAEGNEDLKKQIETLQAENKSAKEQYEKDLNTFKINNAIDLALTEKGAKNLKAVKALIDMDAIKINGDKIEGVEDQIKNLLNGDDTSFLFNKAVEQEAPKGMKAGEGTAGVMNKPYTQMNYSERVAYLAAGGKPE